MLFNQKINTAAAIITTTPQKFSAAIHHSDLNENVPSFTRKYFIMHYNLNIKVMKCFGEN